MAYIAKDDDKEMGASKLSIGSDSKPINTYTGTNTPVINAGSVNTPTTFKKPVSGAESSVPLNKNYNIMKGLMSGAPQGSSALTERASQQVNVQGNQQQQNMANEEKTYRDSNKFTSGDMTAGEKAWQENADSDTGKAFAKTMGTSSDPTGIKDYSSSGSYIKPTDIALQSQGTPGMKNLDVMLQGNSQHQRVASLIGQQNQVIGDKLAKVGDVTKDVQKQYTTDVTAAQNKGKEALTKADQEVANQAAAAANARRQQQQAAAGSRQQELNATYGDYQNTDTALNKQLGEAAAHLQEWQNDTRSLEPGVKEAQIQAAQDRVNQIQAQRDATFKDWQDYTTYDQNEAARMGDVSNVPDKIYSQSQADLSNRLRSMLGMTDVVTPTVVNEAPTAAAYGGGQGLASGKSFLQQQLSGLLDPSAFTEYTPPPVEISNETSGGVESDRQGPNPAELEGGFSGEWAGGDVNTGYAGSDFENENEATWA